MSDQITTLKSAIENSILNIASIIQINWEVQKNQIHKSFNTNIGVETGNKGITLELDWNKRKDNLDIVLNTVLYQLIGTSCVGIYEEHLKHITIPSSKQNLNNIKIVIAQIRHAFAHSPINPKWKVKPTDKIDLLIELEHASFCWKGTTLTGKYLKPNDFGGYEGFIEMLQYLHRFG